MRMAKDPDINCVEFLDPNIIDIKDVMSFEVLVQKDRSDWQNSFTRLGFAQLRSDVFTRDRNSVRYFHKDLMRNASDEQLNKLKKEDNQNLPPFVTAATADTEMILFQPEVAVQSNPRPKPSKRPRTAKKQSDVVQLNPQQLTRAIAEYIAHEEFLVQSKKDVASRQIDLPRQDFLLQRQLEDISQYLTTQQEAVQLQLYKYQQQQLSFDRLPQMFFANEQQQQQQPENEVLLSDSEFMTQIADIAEPRHNETTINTSDNDSANLSPILLSYEMRKI